VGHTSISDSENVRHVGLWQFGGVGDMLLATPVIDAIGRTYSDAKVHVWCSDPPFAEFLRRFANVESIHPFRVYEMDVRTLFISSVRDDLFRIRDDMLAMKLDLLINLHVPRMLDWWAVEWWMVKHSGATRTMGLNPPFMGQGSVYDVFLNASERGSIHYTELYRRLLEKAGIPASTRTRFPLTEVDHAKTRTLLENTSVNVMNPWVCLHAGGRRLKVEGKLWPAERFAALAQKLHTRGVTSVLIGVKSEEELAAEICRLVPGCVNLIGKTDLAQMAALISLSHLFVGQDSGPFHIAVAVGRPAIGLCGRSDAESEYLAYKDTSIVTVFVRSDPLLIEVDEVFAKALYYLETNNHPLGGEI
jgi:ADP-heptose:LPS heptosyltransferase